MTRGPNTARFQNTHLKMGIKPAESDGVQFHCIIIRAECNNQINQQINRATVKRVPGTSAFCSALSLS